MLSEALSAVGLVAAAVAVYYAWRSADLARLERRERALRDVADAVDEVRRTAGSAVASYNARRPRAEQSEAAAAFRRAQGRLELALAAGPLPAALMRDRRTHRHLATLSTARPLQVAGAATGVIDLIRRERTSLDERGLRGRRGLGGALGPEASPRPSGGCAVRTAHDGMRRLELVLPADGRGLVHQWCDADGERTWFRSTPFATDLGPVDAVAICLGDYGSPASLEIVARAGGRLHHLSRPTSFGSSSSGRPAADEAPAPLPIDDAAGVPAIVQGRFGNKGNFEVVAPRRGGGIAHLWRDNDADRRRWRHARTFGRERVFEAVALVHGDLEDHHLEVLARTGSELCHFWRDNASPSSWHAAVMLDAAFRPIEHRAAGVPGFIQSRRRGSRGNFEVITPVDGGGVMHLWRNNDDPSFVWSTRSLDEAAELHAATAFESGLRPDGSRDLVVFGFGQHETVHMCEPQPLPDRRPGRRQAGAATGSLSRSSAPPPGAAAAVTDPPWASAAWRTIASPSPDPGVLREDAAR
jgi:hypothetical protein